LFDPGRISPVTVGITNATYGVYFADSKQSKRKRMGKKKEVNRFFTAGYLSGSHSFHAFSIPAAGPHGDRKKKEGKKKKKKKKKKKNSACSSPPTLPAGQLFCS